MNHEHFVLEPDCNHGNILYPCHQCEKGHALATVSLLLREAFNPGNTSKYQRSIFYFRDFTNGQPFKLHVRDGQE